MAKRIFLVVVIAAVLTAGAFFGYYYIRDKIAENSFSDLKIYAGVNSEGDVNLDALYKKNKDIVGWIKIKGTHVDYPVMQTPDYPDFYLRKNFDKEYSVAGTPFLEENSIIGKSSNYLIYAHNIKSGSMFHDILKYDSQKWYKAHKTFTFSSRKEGKGVYKVVAAFKTTTRFSYQNYAMIDNIKDYNKYMDECLERSEIKGASRPSFGEQLVTLSTCSYHVSDHTGRFVVVAKKIR